MFRFYYQVTFVKQYGFVIKLKLHFNRPFGLRLFINAVEFFTLTADILSGMFSKVTKFFTVSRSFFSSVVCIGLVFALFSSGATYANVYQFIDDQGAPHFSDRQTDARYTLLIRSNKEALVSSPTFSKPTHLDGLRKKFNDSIVQAAKASRIEPALLHALIEVESAYNPSAVSPKGAVGLMQLMPATARMYGVDNPLNIHQNLRAGSLHLRNLLDQFSGNKELALAGYNAGARAVIANGSRIPPYAETVLYVPNVLRVYNRLRDPILAVD